MTFKTLVSTDELFDHLDRPDWVILDCRFSLTNKQFGRQEYLKAHIPGAVYAHLEEDLSGLIKPGITGRHPLPSIEQATKTFSHWGIKDGIQVVAYDDAGGALAAVRAWWMLRWLGHEAVAVLDGGWQSWNRERKPVKSNFENRTDEIFIPRPHPEKFISAQEVEKWRLNPAYRVFDARTAERFQGRNETIDPVAGHIPGSINSPYTENLTPDGYFRPTIELFQRYENLLGKIPAERAVFYCGSGVTSIHNILAMVHAGLGEARLYVGSWSEWITDPSRPISRE